MSAVVRPVAARLNREFAQVLRARSYTRNVIRILKAITPAAAANCRTYEAFLDQVEYNGRRLAKLNVAPVEVQDALREFNALLGPVLDGRFQPVREQLALATRLVLNRAYYEVREAETQALFGIYQAEVDAHDFHDFLRRVVRVLTPALRARAGRIIELNQAPETALSKPQYIRPDSPRLRLIADPKMRGSHSCYWSYPLSDRIIAQFGFAVEYPWLPRELVLLSAAAERCRATAERRRLESENLRLEREARCAEEDERRRIGRELHDEAGQSLLLLRLQLEMMERNAPPALREPLAGARGVAESAITEIRRIVSALSPQVLERLGLRAALRHLTARFQKMHPAAIDLRITAKLPVFPPSTQEALYRVAQECLLNIAKHSSAKRVKVSLRIADSMIKLSVTDDGSGFSGEGAASKPFTFGLTGMRERAALLGGKLETTSAPGKGVTVKLELPLVGA
jgi:signal transduction histidine kinase